MSLDKYKAPDRAWRGKKSTPAMYRLDPATAEAIKIVAQQVKSDRGYARYGTTNIIESWALNDPHTRRIIKQLNKENTYDEGRHDATNVE